MPFAYQRQLRFTVLANIKKGGFIITELPLIQLLAEYYDPENMSEKQTCFWWTIVGTKLRKAPEF